MSIHFSPVFRLRPVKRVHLNTGQCHVIWIPDHTVIQILPVSEIVSTHQFLFLMLSACGDLMYSSTICFHRLLQSQPRKKLWTFLILAMSGSSAFSSLRSLSCKKEGKFKTWGRCGLMDRASAFYLRPNTIKNGKTMQEQKQQKKAWELTVQDYGTLLQQKSPM